MAEISKVSSADFLTGQTSNKTKKSNSDFGDIFSDKKANVSTNTNRETRENTKPKETKEVEKSVESTETKKPEGKVEDKKVDEAKKVVETTEKQITAEDGSEIPAEVIALVCSMFGVSEEDALAMMDELGITEDMLFDISEVTKLLVAVNELEDASELLDVDGIKEFIEQFKNIVDESKNVPVNDNKVEKSQDANQEVNVKSVEVIETVATNQVKDSTVTDATTTEDTNDVNTEVVKVVETNNQQQRDFNSNQQSGMPMGDEPSIVQPVQVNVLEQQVQFQEIVQRANIPSNIDTEDVISQLVDNMKVEIKSDTSEVRIHLRPEHLGDVTLKIITQNGIVTAQFVAENERIRQIIESNFQDLSETLRQQGFDIGDLSASVSDGNNNETGYESDESGTTIKLDDELEEVAVEETSYYQDADDIGASRHNYTA